jgi:hypothetical protein
MHETCTCDMHLCTTFNMHAHHNMSMCMTMCMCMHVQHSTCHVHVWHVHVMSMCNVHTAVLCICVHSTPCAVGSVLASALELSSPKGSGRGPTRRRRLYLEPTPSTPLTHLIIFASFVLILPSEDPILFRQLSYRLRRRPTTTSSLSLFTPWPDHTRMTE